MKNRFWVIFYMLITQLLYLQAQEKDTSNGSGILAQHYFQDRILLLFADNAGKARLEKQIQALNARPTDLMLRKLLIYVVTPQGITYPSGEQHSAEESRQLCEELSLQLNGFTLLLIDLNGQESLRSNTPISAEKLFLHIDSTPLRRSEMLDSLLQEMGGQ